MTEWFREAGRPEERPVGWRPLFDGRELVRQAKCPTCGSSRPDVCQVLGHVYPITELCTEEEQSR